MAQEHIKQKELRVVVLGFHDSGKSLVINTLLSRTGSEFGRGTTSCVRREGMVCGRKLICIDTPGWWRTHPLSDTANFIKQKIVLSASECLPGPHAFLLVIDTDASFTEKNRMSIEEHLGLFGERVWEHTIVVFTGGKYLRDKSIDQHIKSEGDALKSLVDKCRYRILFINSTEGCDKTVRLLKEIDDIAEKNRNGYFKFDENILSELKGKRKIHQERAKLRQQKVSDQRETLHKCGCIPSLPEPRILLLGWSFSGKTSAKNTILGQENPHRRTRTYQSERHSRNIAGRQVSVVDTPGWWKYLPANYAKEWVKTELKRGLTFDSKAPHTILLAIPADATFLEEQRKITEDNMKMFGDQVWRHTIVLFTCGDRLGDMSIEEHIESEGEPLQWLIEKCGNRYHVMSWYDKEDQVKELLKKIEEVVATNILFRPEPIAQYTLDIKPTENLTDAPSEMVHFLDQKLQKMDKKLEMKLSEMTGSISDLIGISNQPSPQHTSEEISSRNRPLNLPKSSMKESSISNPNSDETHPCHHPGPGDKKQTSQEFVGEMEKMKDVLEREWGRREFEITQRFQRELSALREYGSEDDVHNLNRAYRNVLWWMQHETSGIVSDLNESDLGTEETEETE